MSNWAVIETELAARADALSTDDLRHAENLTTTIDEVAWWEGRPRPTAAAQAFVRDVFRAAINDGPKAGTPEARAEMRASLLMIADLLREIAAPPSATPDPESVSRWNPC